MENIILKVQGKYFDKIRDIDKKESDGYDKSVKIEETLNNYDGAMKILEDLCIDQPKPEIINYPLNIKAIYLNKLVGLAEMDDNRYGRGSAYSKVIKQCEEMLGIIEAIENEQANYVKVVEKEEQA